MYIDAIEGFLIWFWFVLILSLPFDFAFSYISVMLQMVWRHILSVIIESKLVMWESRLSRKIRTISLIIIAHMLDFYSKCRVEKRIDVRFHLVGVRYEQHHQEVYSFFPLWGLIGLLKKTAYHWRNRQFALSHKLNHLRKYCGISNYT